MGVVAGVLGDKDSGERASSNQTGESRNAPPNSHGIPSGTAQWRPPLEVDGTKFILG